ncbi:alpha/beta hydrolase [Aggregicoccus sp. 17bor-14]|uniref:alpha/beta hydrolase n=1 Tax=Myxococcaceae TaxID=31 RepID=UPI00129CBD79|nr:MULTISPECIES: alpha/beta hydrolase [Myxococcaceae]MBF5042251.1 alpha/beta hydrolase [Simulacricoccus sp. 17bor-14]MRI88026.1 alpha/beta hydrolase [Aggregicoccus sp. 17bor-14]
MALTQREQQEVEAANASGRTPVVFVHGLWLLAGSWKPWREHFEKQGYATLAPDWPDDPPSVEEARAHPEAVAGQSLGSVTAHFEEVIGQLRQKPIVIGHSTGGLITQILAGRGLAAGAAAIDPGPFRGVLPLPYSSLKVASIGLRDPRNRHRGVPLTYEQFRYGFANALPEEEAKVLYEREAVPAPGMALFQMAFANLNPRTEAHVDTRRSDRGPLLVVSGERDHTVPWAIAHASYGRYKHNPNPTRLVKIPGRGHSLTIDHGWQEVADTVLRFLDENAVRH